MAAAEEMVEASTGIAPKREKSVAQSGFEAERVARYLARNADAVSAANDRLDGAGVEALASTAERLRELAASMTEPEAMPLEDLDRTLTVLEERMVDAIRSAAPEAELVALREQADRELAPYRSRMSAVQLRQVQQQFLTKRLLESRALPRLSLFYMGVAE
jgi:hypothetical protein